MDRNPQAEMMADESMLRTLAAQAQAIWPQERPLIERYRLPADARILDVGCGSGEITARLAELYPEAEIVGVDVLEGPLVHARARTRDFASRVRFELGDAFDLAFGSDSFDLVLCRHVTQSVPAPEKLIEELARVCKPGGVLHVLSEDYRMLHFPVRDLDPDRLWERAARAFSQATGVDERVGRRTWSMLKGIGFVALSVDYVVVDTQRVPRAIFADILRAWRDGYATTLDRHGLEPGEAQALFDQIIASILDPDEYAVWHVPIISGRKPSPAR